MRSGWRSSSFSNFATAPCTRRRRTRSQRKRSARQRFKWRRERLRREALGLDPDPPWPTGIPVFGTSFISGRIDNIVDGDGPSLTGRRLNGTR